MGALLGILSACMVSVFGVAINPLWSKTLLRTGA